MGQPALILLCDHRGEGLSAALQPLAALGYRVEVVQSVRECQERLSELCPDLIVLDPLAGGGSIELSRILEKVRNPEPAILLVADPANPLPAVLSSRALARTAKDVVRRDAPFEEFLMRVERLRQIGEGARELDEMRY
jgi:CheY-like chemotaxis protein